jgi:serine/threonine protein kinase/tetratricopeptide (TPR) repeat protein
MSDAASTRPPQAPGPPDPAATNLVSGLMGEQRERWRRGERVLVESYLERHPTLRSDPDGVLDLLYNEFVAREECGETPRPEEYCERFPHLAAGFRAQLIFHRAFSLRTLAPPTLVRGPHWPELRGGPAQRTPGPLPHVPGYEVLGELGRGGMGVVYKARHVRLDRVVALKMILAGAYAGAQECDRFRAEAQSAARLQHPHIVQIHEVGEHDGRPYLTLEFVDGGSLAQRLTGAPFPAAQAAPLVHCLARAVQHAHERGVVHRDLKPANILLTAEGVPKITDFGLARRLDGDAAETRTGAILGTPCYMAPEQAAGRAGAAGTPADVYGLGAILYELLTGRPPFLAATALETLELVRDQEPVPPRRLQPRVPRDLETICLKCLQKDPGKRYASAAELAQDLERFLSGRSVRARPTPRWERALKWARRRPAVAGLLAVSGLAAILLMVTLAVSNVMIRKEKERAEANYRAAEVNRQIATDAVNSYYTAVSEDVLLREPGQHQLRKQLLQYARDFYERFVKERQDDPGARAELARALWRLANITSEVDLDTRKATELLQEAEAIQEPLAHASPDVAPLQSDLARTLHSMGALAYDRGDMEAADGAYQRARAIREELVHGNPEAAENQDGLAQTCHNLANLYRRLGKTDEALAALKQSLPLRQRLADRHPEVPSYQANLAVTHMLFGVLYSDRDQLMSEKASQDARDLLVELVAAHPRISRYQHLLGETLQNLGILYHDRQKDRAGACYEESLTIRKKLADENPQVIDYQSGLARTHCSAGLLCSSLGQPAEAEKHFQAALKVQDKVGPGTQQLGFRRDWAASHNNLGILYHQTNRVDLAEQSYRQAIKLIEGLPHEQQELPEISVALGGFYGNLGEAFLDRLQFAEALVPYDQAIERLEAVRVKKESDPHLGPFLRNTYLGRALARVRTDDRAGALADAQKVEAEVDQGGPLPGNTLYGLARVYAICSNSDNEHAAHAVRLLVQAREAGFFKDPAQVENLKNNKDFGPLWSREDYKMFERTLDGQR